MIWLVVEFAGMLLINHEGLWFCHNVPETDIYFYLFQANYSQQLSCYESNSFVYFSSWQWFQKLDFEWIGILAYCAATRAFASKEARSSFVPSQEPHHHYHPGELKGKMCQIEKGWRSFCLLKSIKYGLQFTANPAL